MTGRAGAKTPSLNAHGASARHDASTSVSSPTRLLLRVALVIKLNDPLAVAAMKKVDLASVGAGTYIGTATRPGPNGSLTAIEVLVFPETMRGAGEGHYAWDLEPESMMTNGTVSGVVSATAGRELAITYKGGSNTVTVPADVPVVTFAPAERADLTPGATVFLAATKNAEGQLTASRVTVSKDGVAPPM